MQLTHEARSGPGIAVNHPPHISPEKAILPFKALFIYLFKCFKMVLNTSIIRGILRIARPVDRDEGITEAELRSGSRRKNVSKARRLFCQFTVVKLGYPGAKVARFLGVSTSAVVRAASSEELPKIGSHL